MLNLKNTRVSVTGGGGFLGRVVVQKLKDKGAIVSIPRQKDYDLTTEAGVVRMYDDQKPDAVIHLAAVVGGIGANRENPGKFFHANMAMGLHLVEHARQRGLRKFVHTGTVCAYPKITPVPFREDDLWNGYPEETNAPYGVAKKALFVMLDGYQRQYGLASSVVVPVNLYGPWDNFDLNSSHVIPALVRKCEEARTHSEKTITCWGTGSASREFLYVDDAAEAIVRATQVMEEPLPINLGTGGEIKIKDLVELIARLCDFKGGIEWDSTKPDGQPRRCLDTTRAAKLLGWKAQVGFEEGLKRTISWWRQHGTKA